MVECFHIVSQCGTKLVKNILMPLIILVVNLSLYSSKVDNDGSERFFHLRGIEGLTALSDLI